MPDRVEGPRPKFALLNELLVAASLPDFDYVIVCDDDVLLPEAFLDRYLACVEQHDFALSQPARTHDSFTDHPFVERLDGLTARWTRFVEIGPVFCMRRDAVPLLVPFDETSPMGWGYDFVWPCILEEAGLRPGIVDATPVSHSLRKSVTRYRHGTADEANLRFSQKQVAAPREPFWMKEIVGVQYGNKSRPDVGQRCYQTAPQSQIPLIDPDRDPWVAYRARAGDRVVRRRVVDDQDLETLVGLRKDALKCVADISLMLEGRDQDGNVGRVCPGPPPGRHPCKVKRCRAGCQMCEAESHHPSLAEVVQHAWRHLVRPPAGGWQRGENMVRPVGWFNSQRG